MEKEIWKFVVGYEDLYEVSNLGQIRSIGRKTTHLMTNTLNKGYYRVSLTKDGKNYSWLVHRLVARAFLPEILGKNSVNHIEASVRLNSFLMASRDDILRELEAARRLVDRVRNLTSDDKRHIGKNDMGGDDWLVLPNIEEQRDAIISEWEEAVK